MHLSTVFLLPILTYCRSPYTLCLDCGQFEYLNRNSICAMRSGATCAIVCIQFRNCSYKLPAHRLAAPMYILASDRFWKFGMQSDKVPIFHNNNVIQIPFSTEK